MVSILKVDKLDPQSGTALEIGTSGDTITVPSGATLDISSATLTPPATLPASSGVNLTALNATNLGSGTVPTARLGTGTASSSTVLYGDQTYKAEPGGGKINQVVLTQDNNPATIDTTSTSWVTSGLTVTITPSASDSKVLLKFASGVGSSGGGGTSYRQFYRNINSGGDTALGAGTYGMAVYQVAEFLPWQMTWIDSPSTTDSTVYSVWHKTTNASNESYICWSGSYYSLIAMEILA